MNKLFILLFITVLAGWRAEAQYAPQAPLPGNEGIIDTSSLFKEWVSGCTLYRGWLDIADKSLGQPTLGAATDIYGPPGTELLSLGDSGVAVLTFNHSLRNGPGPDFAVFENAFADPFNDTMAYLELAFVEVSSDGVNFFRFPASSLMQDTAQIDNFTYSDARYYHNLAGKYIYKYGTPFDLEDLKGVTGLDLNAITHIRLVDVAGSIDPLYASKDKDGHIINCAYPSAYPSCGFDLRGVGVINSNMPTSVNKLAQELQLSIYPNPATSYLVLQSNGKKQLHYQVTDISGRTLAQGSFTGNTHIDVSPLSTGLYLIRLNNGEEQYTAKFRKQ